MKSGQQYICVFFELVDPFPKINICYTLVPARDESDAYNRASDARYAGLVPGTKSGNLVNWYVAPLEGGSDFHASVRRWYSDTRNTGVPI